MIESYDILSASSTGNQENYSSSSEEPTYINETELLFSNRGIGNVDHQHDLSGKEQTIRVDNTNSKDKSDAATIIQRAYRSYRQHRKPPETLHINHDEASNYLQFWDHLNRRSGYSLITTTSNSASDSKNSDCDERGIEADIEEVRYHCDHIYDCIPYDISSPESSPYKLTISQRDYLLSQQRKHSMDTHNHSSVKTAQHRHSEQINPHSVFVHKNDLLNLKNNLYVVNNNQPLKLSVNNSLCTPHNIFQNQSIPATNCQRSVPISGTCHLYAVQPNHSQLPDENYQRQQYMHKQSKIMQNQKLTTDKRLYRIGLNIFNKNPAAGISYLTKYQHVKADPSHIAKFLLTKNGISRHAIGEYIGSIGDQLALEVTKFFLRRINMKNKEVDEALRSFIYYVHLPGESQKICHLMEEFQVAYLLQNETKHQFKSNDTVMILAYAIIMLQTDAHNQSIRKTEKMTQGQFINNLRGVDENCDIDRNILEQIYARVTTKEIKTQTDHTEQVRQLNESICGAVKPAELVNRIRRFICYCRLSEITQDIKKKKYDSHQRDVFLFNDILLITERQHKSKKQESQYLCKNTLSLVDLQVNRFSTNTYPYGIDIVNRNIKELIIKLNARCEPDRTKFIFDLSDCILESLEMLRINYADFTTSSNSLSQDSPKTLVIKDPNTLVQKVDKPIPNTRRRQDSLVRNGRPDIVQSVCRNRNQSLSEGYNMCTKSYGGNFH